MNNNFSRRKFVTSSLQGSLAAAVASSAISLKAAEPAAPAAPAVPAGPIEPMPSGKICGLPFSRLMIGTNIITGHMHSRDLFYLKDWSKQYFTDEKILETFAIAEKHGVDTFMTHHEPNVVRLVAEHHKRGGKLKWLVAPTPQETKSLEEFEKVVRMLKGLGVNAMYVHGAAADPLAQSGKVSHIRECVDIIKNQGVPAGVAAHDLETIKAVEAAKVPCDYYVKTFHHHKYSTAPKPEQITRPFMETPVAYWCANPTDTIAFMKTVKKPWIAYKVMAAGAIRPKDAFRYSYYNGADFILAGMFDFQIEEDAKIAREGIAKSTERERPWCA